MYILFSILHSILRNIYAIVMFYEYDLLYSFLFEDQINIEYCRTGTISGCIELYISYICYILKLLFQF